MPAASNYDFCIHIKDTSGNLILPDIEGECECSYGFEFGDVKGNVEAIRLLNQDDAARDLLTSKDPLIQILGLRIKDEIERDPNFQEHVENAAEEDGWHQVGFGGNDPESHWSPNPVTVYGGGAK